VLFSSSLALFFVSIWRDLTASSEFFWRSLVAFLYFSEISSQPVSYFFSIVLTVSALSVSSSWEKNFSVILSNSCFNSACGLSYNSLPLTRSTTLTQPTFFSGSEAVKNRLDAVWARMLRSWESSCVIKFQGPLFSMSSRLPRPKSFTLSEAVHGSYSKANKARQLKTFLRHALLG